jgi:GNAT superfamily N-acetyltransferase
MGSPGQHVAFREYNLDQVGHIVAELRALYADVYAEPPYYETESDAVNFVSRLNSQSQEPSFHLIAAWDKERLAGFVYGFTIDPDSSLWATVFLSPDPERRIQEWIYPVAFLSELLVAVGYRRRGIARVLHDRFLAGRDEPKAVLLAHSDATAAQVAYKKWGWYRVGVGQPFSGTSLYDTLVKNLPAGGVCEHS